MPNCTSQLSDHLGQLYPGFLAIPLAQSIPVIAGLSASCSTDLDVMNWLFLRH